MCKGVFYTRNESVKTSGTQKNYNSFFVKKYYDGKGKELEFPEGRGGGKGEPGFPLKRLEGKKLIFKITIKPYRN
jgi:hypothetical protein